MSNNPLHFQEEEGNVVRLRPASGGEGDKDWLSKLPLNTTFVCKSNQEYIEFRCHEYTLVSKEHGISLIRQNRREGDIDKSYWQWVDNSVFCKEHSLRAVL